MKQISELVNLIQLEQISDCSFQGNSQPIGSATVFGGQVLAQALYAMKECVPEERKCHSYHAYFILAGDLNKKITYEVETIRDGGSFSVRRVLAKQNDVVIFLMAASFQAKENGYEHQIEMPQVPAPEQLHSWDDMYQQLKGFIPKQVEQFLAVERPISFKPTVVNNPVERKALPPIQNVWFKVKGKYNGDTELGKSILSYISDYNILTTALHPHADKAHFGNTQMATLDHSMWFFRDFDLNDWFLYSIESPSTSNSRGFTRGNIFSRDGKLVASVTQEGLMRPKKQ